MRHRAGAAQLISSWRRRWRGCISSTRGATIAVLEVGLGGRLDATNVCHPLAGVITNISRDHTNVLGSTLAQIAGEKAGIVKPGIPLISGVADGAGRRRGRAVCRRKASPLYRLGREFGWRPANGMAERQTSKRWRRLEIDVETPWGNGGRCRSRCGASTRLANAALAVAAAGMLASAAANFRSGRFPPEWRPCGGRRESKSSAGSRWVVVDAAHNWASTEALVRTLESKFSARRRILIFAGTKDKDVGGTFETSAPAV